MEGLESLIKAGRFWRHFEQILSDFGEHLIFSARFSRSKM